MAEAGSGLHTLVAAAEQAAAGGDNAAAERLLREALGLQETSLGPRHPDLANTLNNLGVVCEMTGKTADAEQCYRRAHAIATAALEPEHPFVATSRKNLEDFCNARGIPLEPPGPIASPIPAAPPVPAAPPLQATPPAPAESLAPAPAGRSSRSLVITAVVVGGLAFAIFLAIFVAGRPRIDSSEPPPSSSSSAPPLQQSAPDPEPARATSPATPAKTATAPNDRAPASGTRATKTTGPAPSVVSAQLCRNPPSGEWRCDTARGPLDPGTLFFYTRIASPNDTVVQHRWYRGDQLHQMITLQVRANQSGYRTYSRNTVSPDRSGDWKVELRAQDGRILHEERFNVR